MAASSIEQIRFSPESKFLAVGTGDGQTGVWSTVTGKLMARGPTHKNSIVAISISKDGALAASSDSGGTVEIWRFPGGQRGITKERRCLGSMEKNQWLVKRNHTLHLQFRTRTEIMFS